MNENECAPCCPFRTLLRRLWGAGSMNTRQGWALAPLRLVMFVMFFTHGWDKLVHFSKAVGAARGAGFPPALLPIMASCLIAAELGGSILMLVGAGVRIAALLQGFVILVILSTVKSGEAFSQGALIFHMGLAICITLLILGNGRPTILPSRREQESCENKH